MTLTGVRWRPPACVLLLLLLLEVLLLMVPTVASVSFNPNYQKTLPANLVTLTESNVLSVCKCRQLCVRDNSCNAYTVDRLASETTNCLFTSQPVSVNDLESRPFGVTFIKNASAGENTIVATPSIAPPPPQPTTVADVTTTSSINSPPAHTTTSAEVITTSTGQQTTTSTATSTTASTIKSATTSTTTSTTTTTAGEVTIYLSASKGRGTNLAATCGAEGGVPSSLTTMEKVNQVVTLLESHYWSFVNVPLAYNDGDEMWLDGTLFSDTAVTYSIQHIHSDDCHSIGNGKFWRISCSVSQHVVCEKP